ncbi:MAG: Gfo/Idh/MocA family oxidoreductase [Gemmatimonadota bacterium]
MAGRSGQGVVRLAVLGCGAVTELLHLPAAARVPGLEVVSLVDRDLVRARRVAERYRVPDARTGLELGDTRVDAVLVALPNRLHAPVSIDFLRRGVAVLVEKPMALSSAEGRAMVEAAGEGNAVLQVAQMKRFAHGARLVKDLLDAGRLGTLTDFTVEWGEDFGWPLASGSSMSPDEAGGGVLVDFGSHLLDLLCWWLGFPSVVRYADDNRGGVEADCELELTMRGDVGTVPGEVRFSRLRTLSNVVRIRGERLTVEWDHMTADAVRILPTDWKDGAPPRFSWTEHDGQTFEDLFVRQLESFVDAVGTGPPSLVPGESVLPSLELIERCYRCRGRLEEPWDRPVGMPDAAEVGA